MKPTFDPKYEAMGMRPFNIESDRNQILNLIKRWYINAFETTSSLEVMLDGPSLDGISWLDDDMNIKGAYLFRKCEDVSLFYKDGKPFNNKNGFDISNPDYPKKSDLCEVVFVLSGERTPVLKAQGIILYQAVFDYASSMNAHLLTTTCWMGDNHFAYDINVETGFRPIGTFKSASIDGSDIVLMNKRLRYKGKPYCPADSRILKRLVVDFISLEHLQRIQAETTNPRVILREMDFHAK